jgi:DNA-binding transcriptional ArsR family regulator
MSTPGDLVFKALADPTRRALLDALRDGPRTTGDLSRMHPEMSRFGVMSHLKQLEDAGLILVERVGRTRWNHLNPVPFREVVARWVHPIAEAPADELIRLRAVAEQRGRTTDVRDRGRRTGGHARGKAQGKAQGEAQRKEGATDGRHAC